MAALTDDLRLGVRMVMSRFQKELGKSLGRGWIVKDNIDMADGSVWITIKHTPSQSVYTLRADFPFRQKAYLLRGDERGTKLGDVVNYVSVKRLLDKDNPSIQESKTDLHEHDSDIIKKDKSKKFRVTIVFSGSYEEDLDADMWIEHDASNSYEEWEIKGRFNIDDAYNLASKVKAKPTILNRPGNFSASFSARGTYGEILYKEAEKFFGVRKISKTKDSEVNL